MSECPVCGKAGVDDGVERCPQCHSDLECFALLDSLHEAAPGQPSSPDLLEVKRALGGLQEAVSRLAVGRARRFDWPVLSAIAGLAALLLALHLAGVDRRFAAPLVPAGAPEPVATAAAVDAVADSLDAVEERLKALAAEHTRAPGQPSPAEETAAPAAETTRELVLHDLGFGETLWSVARRYYGSGRLYPVLMALNPGLGPYHSGSRTLRILVDREDVAEVYRQITPEGAEGKLFRYHVQEGDDWNKLAERFLGQPERAGELAALNPKADLRPGDLILIALE